MGDQNGELACLEMIAKLNRKKKNSSFFFLLQTQPMKNQGFFAYYSPLNFLFLSIKLFFPRLVGPCLQLAMVSDPKLQFSVALK